MVLFHFAQSKALAQEQLCGSWRCWSFLCAVRAQWTPTWVSKILKKFPDNCSAPFQDFSWTEEGSEQLAAGGAAEKWWFGRWQLGIVRRLVLLIQKQKRDWIQPPATRELRIFYLLDYAVRCQWSRPYWIGTLSKNHSVKSAQISSLQL